MGAVYPDVPAVTLPIDGGGTAKFTDVSDTTASASDVAQGKYFYTSSGVYTQGTASGGGGASNVVTGTFKGTTTGAAMDVTLNYSGTGYPIAVMVYPSGGTNKTGSPFYDLIQQYATEYFLAIKTDTSEVPVFDAAGTNGMCSVINRYKYSRSNATSRSQSASETVLVMRDQPAQGGNQTLCKIKSSTAMSVYIASTSYGFAANIEYTYHIIYSS